MTEEKNTTPLHGSNVAREQIPTACKWHISDIYAGENDWQAACEEYKSKLPQLQAMQGQLNTAAAVCAALKLQEELAKLLDKIYAYARLQQDADNTDQKLQALAGEAEGMAAAFSNANAFVEPEMLALGKEKLLQMLDEEPALAEYRFYIENMVRLSDHVLSADKEAVFAQSHLATGTAAAAFRALVSADMQFPEITDGQGNKANVSEGCYLLNMTSPDRVLRKNSFTGLMNTYHQYRNTLAATLTGSARTGYFYATVHNYKDTLEAALAEDNIPSSLYDGLIDTVHDNFAPLHEYIQLKKDVLGVDEFHYYDMYMPISTAGDGFACSFPEACAKVEEALAPLGKEYLTALHKGMTEGWIDVYENKGKRSGAYSWGVYGVHPFVLLNYQARYNSISTIAHEMGHAMHSYFSSQAQSYVNSEYTIFCAEVASTTNENLLLEHTLKHATCYGGAEDLSFESVFGGSAHNSLQTGAVCGIRKIYSRRDHSRPFTAGRKAGGILAAEQQGLLWPGADCGQGTGKRMVTHTALLHAVLCVQVRNRLQCSDRLRQRNFKRRSGSGGKISGLPACGR